MITLALHEFLFLVLLLARCRAKLSFYSDSIRGLSSLARVQVIQKFVGNFLYAASHAWQLLAIAHLFSLFT